ncbi:putative late blight resistance protein R1A-3 [Capsicum chacoense]
MENEGERENNFVVSFSALREDVVNVLDFMERLKNEEDQNAVGMADQIKELKLELAFICTYVQLSHCDLEEFEDEMSDSRQDVENLLRPILDEIDNDGRATMTDEQLNFLLQNLHYLSMYLAEQIFPLVTQYEIVQKVCGNIRDFHGLILNGYVEHEIVEYVLPQLQRMDEKVGIFLWDDLTSNDSKVFKLAHLRMKIIPIELEVMHICYTNLKPSPAAEVGCFIKQLLETSPEILSEYLIHLHEHMEVSTLVHDLEEKSRNEESTNETSRAALDLLKNIELLKEDLKYVYLKAPDSCQWSFPMSDGPLLLHLLHKHLNDLLDSNAYSIALIKEEIELVKEALKFIRSFIVNVEQGLYKDLWARVLDVAYKAKDVIDSIIVRDNGLLHLIFSLPITIKKINTIKEEVSQLQEKIPKNKSLIVVNSPKNPVERKLFTNGKIIVGFKEETNWLISKFTSGSKDLDVISITGMPGSGKTTLAYKVYNDESVCRCFDLRAWCTVDQDYDEKKLLMKLFNQVTGSDLKFSEDIDVADKLRKKLLGKRYLIVLDDVWDTTTWDDLTRPFPEGEKGIRILLTTRQQKVAFHGKGLPLVADLIAGVIAGREKTKSVWLEIRNNLNSFILKSEVDVMKVIELSYDHLPHHLKPCLIYLASFPKDRAMDKDELKRCWHAEGLVEQTGMKSVEEVMEVYFDNLISSSLVIAFNEIGDEATCQIHDLVHDFCLLKAREEYLFGRVSSSGPYSSSHLMPRTVNIDDDKEHFDLNNFVLFSSKMKRHLCMLNHLRFLYIGTEVKSLSSCFSNLWNLETLWVENKGSTLVLLPSIWDLAKLRVLFMTACSFFDMDIDEPILIAEHSKLENLRDLRTLMLSYSKEIVDIFIRFPNLQSLVFDLKESWDYSKERYWFPKLDHLAELDYLRANFESSNANDCGASLATNWSWDFHFPSNLKTLVLYDFPLASDSISTIARLPNLEELFLMSTIIQGEEWNMGEEDTFVNLKYLVLEEVTLAKWEFGEESFPVLEKLELSRFHKLTEIPPNFGDIDSLKIIQLDESP